MTSNSSCRSHLLDVESVHGSSRVLPNNDRPTVAWMENDELEQFVIADSPYIQNKKKQLRDKELAKIHNHKVHSKTNKSTTKVKHIKLGKPEVKTKFQKRKEKLVNILKPPYFILVTILLIVSIHLFGDSNMIYFLEWSPGAWRHQPWRLLTYGLVHVSAAHLALNALVALAVGWWLEREQGWWKTCAVWWSGVAGGALGAAALQPQVRVVGASAAVYAMLTAHLPNVCLRFGHIPLWWFRPLSVVVLASSETCWALLRLRCEGPVPLATGPVSSALLEEEQVAWAAHAFGALIGIPVGFIVFTGENDKKKILLVCWIISIVTVSSIVLYSALHYTYHLLLEHRVINLL